MLAKFDASELTLGFMREAMTDLTVDYFDISPFAVFSPDSFTRCLMTAGGNYEALVLCWKPGQRSLIHNHEGSACVFRVICGQAQEIIYRQDGKKVYPVSSQVLCAGSVRASYDQDIHEIRNPGGRNLVSLHIYAPPLRNMQNFELGLPDHVLGDGI